MFLHLLQPSFSCILTASQFSICNFISDCSEIKLFSGVQTQSRSHDSERHRDLISYFHSDSSSFFLYGSCKIILSKEFSTRQPPFRGVGETWAAGLYLSQRTESHCEFLNSVRNVGIVSFWDEERRTSHRFIDRWQLLHRFLCLLGVCVNWIPSCGNRSVSCEDWTAAMAWSRQSLLYFPRLCISSPVVTPLTLPNLQASDVPPRSDCRLLLLTATPVSSSSPP